ncbi:MAG TPA: hypothetical protein VFR15_16160 [Chloroflexia bacterium]|nr:hypothetical protein [Chloroflexia bacterium]
MHLVVPAIHVRPPRYPCEIAGLKTEDYPTPTPIPEDPFPGGGATPLPDLETVGPFTFDLEVVVEPLPTQPALPPPPEPSLAVPNIPPVPTAPADTTQAAIASMTVVPVPTQIPGLQATRMAEATAFPYPTAASPTVQVGRPSIATTRRGDLSMELRLADNNYLAGENGQALITLRNEGKDALHIAAKRVELANETRRTVSSPWPLTPWMPDGWAGWDRGPMGFDELAPGAVLSDTFTFQVPPPQEAKGQTYNLTAWVFFSRSSPDSGRSDGIIIDLQGGPIPIQVIEPEPRQHLKAVLQLDR